MTPHLFQAGDFTLRSGRRSAYKIECDALTDADWGGVAAAVREERLLEPFCDAVGVPRGGIPLARAMQPYGTRNDEHPTLICEDVVTTGGSMDRFLTTLRDRPGGYIGLCFIARGECPPWVTPFLRMTRRARP